MVESSSSASGPSSKSDLMVDSTSQRDPLYLHAYDNPSLQLVSNQLTQQLPSLESIGVCGIEIQK